MSKSELLSKNSSPEEFFFFCSLCETSWDCLRRLIDTQTADSTWVFFFFPFYLFFHFSKKCMYNFTEKHFFWPCVCVCEVSAARVPSQFLNLDLKILGQNLNIFTSVQKKENRKVSHCTPSLSVNLKILSYICSDLLPPYVSGHFVELPSTVHCSWWAGNRSAHVLWCKCDVPPPSRQLYHHIFLHYRHNRLFFFLFSIFLYNKSTRERDCVKTTDSWYSLSLICTRTLLLTAESSELLGNGPSRSM